MPVIALAIVLIGTGCQSSIEPSTKVAVFDEQYRSRCPQLYARISQNPEADATRNFNAKDSRYIVPPGGGGFLAELPRVAVEDAHRRAPASMRELEGWEDYVGPETCRAFQMDVPNYVVRYNQQIWKHRQGL